MATRSNEQFWAFLAIELAGLSIYFEKGELEFDEISYWYADLFVNAPNQLISWIILFSSHIKINWFLIIY